MNLLADNLQRGRRSIGAILRVNLGNSEQQNQEYLHFRYHQWGSCFPSTEFKVPQKFSNKKNNAINKENCWRIECSSLGGKNKRAMGYHLNFVQFDWHSLFVRQNSMNNRESNQRFLNRLPTLPLNDEDWPHNKNRVVPVATCVTELI